MNAKKYQYHFRPILASFVIGILVGIGQVHAGEVKSSLGRLVGSKDRNSHAEHVGLLKLLLAPEKYDGKRVQTEGIFYAGGKQETFLFLYTEDWQRLRLDNAFTMSYAFAQQPPVNWGKEMNGKRVLIEATLRAPTKTLAFPTGGGLLDQIIFVQEIADGSEAAK